MTSHFSKYCIFNFTSGWIMFNVLEIIVMKFRNISCLVHGCFEIFSLYYYFDRAIFITF